MEGIGAGWGIRERERGKRGGGGVGLKRNADWRREG